MKIEKKGQHRIPKGPVIFVANHTSPMDDLALITAINRYFFVITAPLEHFPFSMRIWIKAMGYIPTLVDWAKKTEYTHGLDTKHAVEQAVKKIDSGESMLIFPEGKLERKKRLLKFHTGAVRIALKTKVPIVPIVLKGARKVVTVKKRGIHKGLVNVIIGKPIYYNDYYDKISDRKIVRRLTDELQEEMDKIFKRK